MAQYTATERRLIIEDTASWKIEYELDEITDEALHEYVQYIREMADDELIHYWKTHVGEWILSRDDVHEAHTDEDGLTPDGDTICDRELECLLDPERKTTYGYLGGRLSLRAEW